MDIFQSKFARNDGPRWLILYGSTNDIESFALKECVMMLQASLPYVVEVKNAADFSEKDYGNHIFIIGTKENNHLLEKQPLDVPEKPESYCIKASDSPWNSQRRMLSICGSDSAGCLYGVEHFNAEKIGAEYANDLPEERIKQFENIADFIITESPAIQERGIWTWGYPIYDYQAFIDNMARLRMNTLILWNDKVPVNYNDIVEYAEKRAIKIIPGFHWGWGMELDLSSREVIEKIKKYVIDTYIKDYAGIKHAGIYFQTLTETQETDLNSIPRVKLACDIVNEIGAELLRKYPDLNIYFGLHAISVLDNYKFLEELDPRISIIWEDAGTIPYCIDPVLELKDTRRGWKLPIDTVDKTIEYSRKLVNLRNKQEFKIVAKGFPNIRWSDFENHKGFILGAQTPLAIKKQLENRMTLWNYNNSLWIKNYPEALRFFQEIMAENPRETMVTVLIEDAMFEAQIQDSSALLGAILWNPGKDKDYYMKYVANDYYRQLKM